MTTVKCPHCKGPLEFDPELAGKIVACPHCNKQFRWPAIAQQVQQPASQVAESGLPQTGTRPIPEIRTSPGSRTGSAGSPAMFGFGQFVTSTIVQVLWILSLVVAAIVIVAVIGGTIYLLTNAEVPKEMELRYHAMAVFAMIGWIVFTLFWLLGVRLVLESIVIVFRIENHLRFLREHCSSERRAEQ
jgi:uncharacterized protein YbaR (Trm112 family)